MASAAASKPHTQCGCTPMAAGGGGTFNNVPAGGTRIDSSSGSSIGEGTHPLPESMLSLLDIIGKPAPACAETMLDVLLVTFEIEFDTEYAL